MRERQFYPYDLAALPDGSYTALLVHPDIKGTARTKLIEGARAGGRVVPRVDADRALQDK